MRTGVLVIALVFMLNEWAGPRHSARSSMSALDASSNPASKVGDSKVRVDFESQIKPILQSKCMPCHFSGGVMYERLPFDRPDTIKKLGTKLFTRIQDENHRRLIRDFLEQESS
jgi:hypothetical protein